MPSSTTTAEVELELQPSMDLMMLSERTFEDVEDVMTAAKLDKADLIPISQEILFDSNFSANEFRLIQLDKDVLESIQTGQVLVFRGDENDSAVLCSDSETFEIKEAETSNALLLFSNLEMPDVKSPSSSKGSSKSNSANTSLNTSDVVTENNGDGVIQEDNLSCFGVKSRVIIDVAHSYLEMKRMRPNLSAVRSILHGSVYDEGTVTLRFIIFLYQIIKFQK